MYSFLFNDNLHISARRPPVEETVSFISSLLSTHGPDYFVRLLGHKARNSMAELGGVNNVAIVLSGRHRIIIWNSPSDLSEAQTIDDFGRFLNLSNDDLEHLRMVFVSVDQGDLRVLTSVGIKIQLCSNY